jgi:integrase
VLGQLDAGADRGGPVGAAGHDGQNMAAGCHLGAPILSFRRICEANNVRLIKVHHIRHTVASLKALHVPARDAQVIPGHSRMAVTLEIYTQTDDEAQLDALTRLHNLFDQA